MEVLTRLKRFLSYLRGEGGFNIMDVTAAVAITATLAAVVVPSVKGSMDNARVGALTQEISAIRNGLLKFNVDTNVMPRLVRTVTTTTTDATISPPTVTTTSTIEPLGGSVALLNGIPNVNSGLRVNGNSLVDWKGPYLERDLIDNPFGGDYFLNYSTLFRVPDPKTGTVSPRISAALKVTGLPPVAAEKVDGTLDDGNPLSGIVQITSESVDGVTQDVLSIIILPAVMIDPETGRFIPSTT